MTLEVDNAQQMAALNRESSRHQADPEGTGSPGAQKATALSRGSCTKARAKVLHENS